MTNPGPGQRTAATPYWFTIPALILLACVIFVPLVYAVRMGFTSWSLIRFDNPVPVGTDNYLRLLNDTRFWAALGRSLVFTVSVVGAQLILGFMAALLLSSLRLGRSLVSALVIIPMMIPSVVASVMWLLMLEPQFGLANSLMRVAGLAGQTPWLASVDTAMWSIVAVELWRGLPFVALIVTAGIVSLPGEPFEAAKVDGATAWHRLRFLTLPMLRNLLALVVALRVMDALKTFDTFYLLTKGGPGNATEIASIYLYRTSFESFQLGYASVVAQGLLLVILLASLSVIVAQGRRGPA